MSERFDLRLSTSLRVNFGTAAQKGARTSGKQRKRREGEEGKQAAKSET